jgi:hypothetical protein
MSEDFEIKAISMSRNEMSKAASRLLKAMNDMQFIDGYTLEQTLMVAMYVVGAGLKKRGVVLQIDLPLKIALAPIVDGYNAQAKREQH